MAYGPSESDDKKFQAEMDCRTLVEAEEIKRDKARYKRALAEARKKMKDIQSVAERKA